MQNLKPRFNVCALIALGCVIALGALYFVLTPASALNAGNVVAFTYENGVRTYYTSTQEALNIGYSGKTIYLARDWVFDDTLEITDSKTLTIDMNGKAIRNTGSETVINVNENANLTLKSSMKSTFTFDGYNNTNGDKKSLTLNTGGLVTGGFYSADEGTGGIYMNNKSTLTLDSVAVAGNKGYDSGALYVKENCNIWMKNNASIEGNAGLYGGIDVKGDDANIHMENSCISRNNAWGNGGAIHSSASGTRIYMEKNSTISENYAQCGGAAYFELSYWGIYSDDKTGSIKGNCILAEDEEDGGGIYSEECKWHTNESMIRGITIADNVANHDGGGLYLNQHWTRIIDCTITGNQARRGAGIYINNNDNSIEGCTITNNICHSDMEGGGVFVYNQYDVTIKGKTFIMNNTRGKSGSADDVFLQETVGNMARAYIKGGVDAGSKVGVRTGIAEDRRIGINISTYTYGTYFIDLEGYYVSHGNDEGGDLWQRHSENMKFHLTENGREIGQCKYNEAVTINGNSSDQNKVFWYWDAETASGLNPISSYINDSNKENPFLSFSMPQNDVSVNAIYADCISSGRFYVDKPVAGKELPTQASFIRTDSGQGPSSEITGLPVVWYMIDDDGSEIQASGNARYNKTYIAHFYISKQQYAGVAFSQSITANDVEVFCSGESHNASNVEVQENTGLFMVTSWKYTTEKPSANTVETATVNTTVGTSARDLEKALPNTASVSLADGTTTTVNTNKSGQMNWPEGLFDNNNYVANHEGGEATYSMYLPLAESEDIPGLASKYLKIIINVSIAEIVSTPELTPSSGTYNRYSGTTRMNDSLKLTITASCANSNAEIEYNIDEGETRTYYESDGIELEGKENETAKHTVKIWAKKQEGGAVIQSEVGNFTYYLDDTLKKEITINCSDTGFYEDTNARWQTSFIAAGDLGKEKSIKAPVQENRTFDHWEWENAPEGVDTTSEFLYIENFSLAYSGKIKAVYVPTITVLDVGISAPTADKELAKNASYIKVGVGSETATTNVISCFTDNAPLTWLPAANNDGTAAHSTIYKASTLIKSTLADGVYYNIADSVKLFVNGQDGASRAYVTPNSDGTRTLSVTFPATEGYIYKSLSGVDNVDLTFEQAYAYQLDTDAKREVNWGLHDEAVITYTCGETDFVDIKWETPTAFNKDKLEAQKLSVIGTVEYPSYVDKTGAPETVIVNINVAAPETVQTPTATVESGTYNEAQSVKLSSSTAFATIRYTTDGTDPTETSPVYNDEIKITNSTTIKARAYRAAMAPSEVATFDYVIQLSFSLNGQHVNYYAPGDTVNVNGESTDATKAFLCWSEANTTGLSPFSDYIKDINSQKTSFTMPNNEVNLVAEYADRTKDFTLSVDKPVAGNALNNVGTLSWGTNNTKEVSVQWQNENGDTLTNAPYNTKLKLECTVSQDKNSKLIFDESISAENVKVLFTNEKSGIDTLSARTDSTGRLNIKAGYYTTVKPEIKSVAATAINVAAGTSESSLISALPAHAVATLNNDTKTILPTDTTQSITWPSGLFGTDGNVANPTSSSTNYQVNLPLAATDEVTSVENKFLTVTINVLSAESVATPVLTPISATYTKYTEAHKLTDDLKLKLTVTCSTEGATIKYKVDNGSEQIYNDKTGIEISGQENTQAFVDVEVWAEKTINNKLVKSGSSVEGYVLDDTLNKTITIQCSDTGLYEQGAQIWSNTFTVTADLNANITITAPPQENRIFDHWEWADAPSGTDLTQETLQINKFSLDLSNKIKAVYVPTVNLIDLGVSMPVAHSALAKQATYIKMGTSTKSGTTIDDISEYFVNNGAISWLPPANADGTAAHLTAYTANLSINKHLPEGVKYSFTDTFQLLLNGKTTDGSAYLQFNENEIVLIVTFPKTEGYVCSSINTINDVNLSFNTACTYQSEQDEGNVLSWGLPRETKLKYACGGSEYVNVKWEEPKGFDPNKLQAQELTVTGTITFPDYVNSNGVSPNVQTKIKVAAPENACTVTFDSVGGSNIESKTVISGSTISAPSPAPTKTDCTFDGWYKDASYTNAWDFATDIVEENTTLYAKWTEVDTTKWERLKGGTALGTMKNIVNEGWESSEYAIVTTSKGYQDTLSATGLAGLLNCPVLMSEPTGLSTQTSELLTSKSVKNVIIVGGTSAVPEKVEKQIKALSGITSVKRIAGGTATSTARSVYTYGKNINGGWDSDAIVATVNGYQDALSIAPYAYAKKAPIFLTDSGKHVLGSATEKTIKAGNFTRTLIIGGTSAVKSTVEKQVNNPTRLASGTAYSTCKAVAEFCLANGMTAAHAGVATGQSYQDALCGAALCGKNNSILVLADNNNSKNVNNVVAKNKTALQKYCYVFGGEAAVSKTIWNALLEASK